MNMLYKIVKFNKIYTRTGDLGYTSSLNKGKRIPKNHFLFSILGSIDELNASLAVCNSFTNSTHDNSSSSEEISEIIKNITSIQNDLF